MDTIFEWLKNQNIAYSDKKLNRHLCIPPM